MTWIEISRDNLESARMLFRESQWRSSVSRAYYAIFSAITARLPVAAVPAGFAAPRHRDLPRLVDRHFVQLPWHQRAALVAAVRRCYALRLTADYNRESDVNGILARQAIQDALGALRRLGADHEN